MFLRTVHPLLRIARRSYSDGAPNVNKVWDSVDDAIKAVKSGDTLLSGGNVFLSYIRYCMR